MADKTYEISHAEVAPRKDGPSLANENYPLTGSGSTDENGATFTQAIKDAKEAKLTVAANSAIKVHFVDSDDTVSTATAAGQCLELGNFFLWVDSTGDLRVATTKPTNLETGGAIVGTQS